MFRITRRQFNMKETLTLPPVWCSQICSNAMNDICLENCAVKRNCSGFSPKPDLRLADLPRFPKTEGMSKEEKFSCVTIYLAKIVDHLNGIEDECKSVVIQPSLTRLVRPKVIADVAAGVQGVMTESMEEE